MGRWPPPTFVRAEGRALRGRQFGEQSSHPEQVVRAADDVCGELGTGFPSEACSPEAADGLAPAEDLLDSLADALADPVARVARGAAVDLGATVRRDVLSDVRHRTHGSASVDEGLAVKKLV